MTFTILFSLLTTATILAQDVSVEASKTPTEAHREAQRKLEEEQKTKKTPEQSAVIYSGFLVDLSRAERKSRLLSLRQPADPKNDYKNLYLDEKTNRPKGFVLFALSF